MVGASPPARKRLLDPSDLSRVVSRMAHEIVDRAAADARGPRQLDERSLAIVGVRTGGAHLAHRIARQVTALRGAPVDTGILDITLYRDDVLLGGRPAPLLRGTDVPFDVERRSIVLVDDVLFTGRTVRAALDALLDLGRPALVRLAVVIDRGLRELPIAADFIGRSVETIPSERVRVELVEEGAAEDAVWVEGRQ